MRHPANPSAAIAPAMNIGRYGASNCRLASHAPPTPMLTRTSGKTQQAPASRAAMPPVASATDSGRGAWGAFSLANDADFSKELPTQGKLIPVVDYRIK